MSIDLRPMTADRWPDGLVLWEVVFGVGPWLFHGLHKGHDNRRFEDCSCAFDGDDMVSAADVFMRPCRDAEGSVRLMGGIGSVATLEPYRGLGLSTQLLKRSIEVMEAQGCDWSMLFTGVNPHYAKLGWKDMATFQRRARIADRTAEIPGGWEFEWKDYWKPGEEQMLAPLHAELVQGRPLSVERTELNWRHAVRSRLNRPTWRTLLARRDGRLEGACVVELVEGWFEVLEVVGGEPAQEALAEALLGLLVEREIDQGALQIPRDSALDPFVTRLCATVELEKLGYCMAMPIAGRMSWSEVEAAFAHPLAQHSRLDDF